MPGPKPKPTALKLIEGNPGKQKLPKNEPKPRPIRPTSPRFLNDAAKSIWDELIPELEAMGVVTIVDASVLSGYCAAYEEAMRLSSYLDEAGLVTESPSGYLQQRPEVSIRNKAWDRVAKFAPELGIGAASRSRIEVKKADVDEDPLQDILDAAKREAASRRRKG